MCQKKDKDVDYELLVEFFQKDFFVQEQLAVENSFSTYVCYAPDGFHWLNLYLDPITEQTTTVKSFSQKQKGSVAFLFEKAYETEEMWNTKQYSKIKFMQIKVGTTRKKGHK